MKAIAVTPQKKSVEIINQAEPKILSPTDVKLRMLEAGVCGTDKEICAFQYGTPPSGSEQLVIGHESLGEVIEVGPKVTRVRVGDLVVPMVRRPCSHNYCVACRADRQDFCFTGDFQERGIKERHGFMVQFVVDDEKYMNLVPKEMRDVAVLVEPLTIAEKGTCPSVAGPTALALELFRNAGKSGDLSPPGGRSWSGTCGFAWSHGLGEQRLRYVCLLPRVRSQSGAFIFFGVRWLYERGVGPCTTPPPAYCGARSEPWRARPVPFCRYGFLPPPRTSPRVLVSCVPCRAAACCATTT